MASVRSSSAATGGFGSASSPSPRPKASCGCVRSAPSWSGSRTRTSHGDPAPSEPSRQRSSLSRREDRGRGREGGVPRPLSISTVPVRLKGSHSPFEQGASIVDPKIDLITLGAKDLSRTQEFYEEGFGLQGRTAGGGSVTFGLGDGSSGLELCPWDALADEAGMSPEGTGFRGFTLSYIVEQPAEVDDMLARLVHAGGELSKQPRLAFWGYSAHVADPSGHLWKIASPKRRPLIARKRASNGVPERVEPQELALTIGVADMKRAKRFYADGLGNPTKKDYSKFVSFDGGDGAPDLALYRWDALAADADVAPAGGGFRGFTISHVVGCATKVDAFLDRATSARAKILRREL